MDIKSDRAPFGDYLFKAGPLTEGEQLAKRWVETTFAGAIEPEPRFAAGSARASSEPGALGSAARSLGHAVLEASSTVAALPGRLASWRGRGAAKALGARRPDGASR